MNNRTLIALMTTCVTLSVPALGQPRGPKVLLLFDMEGVTDATTDKRTTVSHPDDYAIGRKSLTEDVNAAIAGLKAAGAAEIVVVDGHGSGNTSGPDVLENELLPPARMHYRDAPFDIYMDSYDHSIDAIVAIAMHAAAGNRQGFLSHTFTFEDVEYKVNGVPFNESMLLAMGAARLKIPVVAISGDDQLETEVRRNLPWVKYATVKHAVDRSRAESQPRAEASRRIEAAAREGLAQLSSAKLLELAPPYRFALTFQDEAQARSAALVPGAEQIGTTVQIRANDFEDGYRQSLRLIGLASATARTTATQAILAAQPNSAAIRTELADWLYGRFLETTKPAAPQTPTTPARYWGAR
jgi:D-amino peptidase